MGYLWFLLTFRGRFSFILAALTLVLVLSPLAETTTGTGWLRALFTILLLSSIGASSGRRWTLIVALVVIVPALLVHWLTLAIPIFTLIIMDGCLTIAAIVFTAGTILQLIYRSRRVTREAIAGAVCVYL